MSYQTRIRPEPTSHYFCGALDALRALARLQGYVLEAALFVPDGDEYLRVDERAEEEA